MKFNIVWKDGGQSELWVKASIFSFWKLVGKFRMANGIDEEGRILMILPREAAWA